MHRPPLPSCRGLVHPQSVFPSLVGSKLPLYADMCIIDDVITFLRYYKGSELGPLVAEAKAKAGVKAGGDEDAHDYQNKDAIDIQAVRNFLSFCVFASSSNSPSFSIFLEGTFY